MVPSRRFRGRPGDADRAPHAAGGPPPATHGSRSAGDRVTPATRPLALAEPAVPDGRQGEAGTSPVPPAESVRHSTEHTGIKPEPPAFSHNLLHSRDLGTAEIEQNGNFDSAGEVLLLPIGPTHQATDLDLQLLWR